MTDEPRAAHGVYISSDALNRSRDIFHAVVGGRSDLLKKIEDKSHSVLFNEAWDEFDDIYVSLYYMNLTREGRVSHIKGLRSSLSHGRRAAANLTVILDTPFPAVSTKAKSTLDFEETLFDETIVADLVRLRSGIYRLIPYPAQLSAVGVGCVYLEFAIFADVSPHSTRNKLIGFDADTLATQPGWKRLWNKFHIKPDSVALSFI